MSNDKRDSARRLREKLLGSVVELPSEPASACMDSLLVNAGTPLESEIIELERTASHSRAADLDEMIEFAESLKSYDWSALPARMISKPARSLPAQLSAIAREIGRSWETLIEPIHVRRMARQYSTSRNSDELVRQPL